MTGQYFPYFSWKLLISKEHHSYLGSHPESLWADEEHSSGYRLSTKDFHLKEDWPLRYLSWFLISACTSVGTYQGHHVSCRFLLITLTSSRLIHPQREITRRIIAIFKGFIRNSTCISLFRTTGLTAFFLLKLGSTLLLSYEKYKTFTSEVPLRTFTLHSGYLVISQAPVLLGRVWQDRDKPLML